MHTTFGWRIGKRNLENIKGNGSRTLRQVLDQENYGLCESTQDLAQ
jgi:hypothetical protein